MRPDWGRGRSVLAEPSHTPIRVARSPQMRKSHLCPSWSAVGNQLLHALVSSRARPHVQWFTLSSSKHVSNQIILGKPCLQLIIMLVPSEGIHILLTTGY
ncbi:hypothetical protein OUZ56_004141 [Daphnia magna]|uniref:Uncharacterized protein n=1 Tax=Daphnia magna TaxID=35525 RepID=A0ABQ9YP91_9CRUS|nr:hypothetical protein OUZ56_004141 [Daphnia magna]